jgi:single-stranded-DNA-specific exonuclease
MVRARPEPRGAGLRTVAKTWQLLPHDRAAIERLAAALGVGPVVAQVLLNRGLHQADSARRFLDSPLTGLHPPERLPGIRAAAERLDAAVRAGRRICVYGDYDADGITGTALLWRGLRLLGAQAEYYVPHRLDEGYGLNLEALRQLARDGTAVVVTVDCGIASLEEADEARRLGLELIVTDHHEFQDRLPDAAVVVHPRLAGDWAAYPFPGLSGSGVAFKLAWALCQRTSGGEKVAPHLRDYLLDGVALATLGTVADVVPLLDENRIFVRHGLHRLKQTAVPGIQALLTVAGLGEKQCLAADDISFRLGPRLNAVGRLGCARMVVDLLTTPSAERAMTLAQFLEKQNVERQRIERAILSEVRARLEGDGIDGQPALVLASPEWHPGVIGIVAGRLAESYARPVLLIAVRQERPEGPPVGQGSGRSVPGFALHEALRACGEHLLRHGGHRAAAGFKIEPERIDVFREHFCAYVARYRQDGSPGPRQVIDGELPLSALTPGLLKALETLEPFGADNPRPCFLAGDLEVIGVPRRIGGGERHLSFRVRQQDTSLRAVAWGMADRLDELMSAAGRCCLVFTPRVNEWQGYRSIELEVVDFQAGARARLGG